jgi:hypothetical protein
MQNPKQRQFAAVTRRCSPLSSRTHETHCLLLHWDARPLPVWLLRTPANGEFELTLGLKKSTTLNGFSPLSMIAPQTLINGQGELDFRFTSPDIAAFFRVESK